MLTPVDQQKTAHQDLHSERGAEPGDRADRAANPVIKVEDLAWLEFEKPDLDRAERFARDFGLTAAARTPDTLYLRGARAGSHCVVIRKGPVSRFVAPAFAPPTTVICCAWPPPTTPRSQS